MSIILQKFSDVEVFQLIISINWKLDLRLQQRLYYTKIDKSRYFCHN